MWVRTLKEKRIDTTRHVLLISHGITIAIMAHIQDSRNNVLESSPHTPPTLTLGHIATGSIYLVRIEHARHAFGSLHVLVQKER